MRTINFVTAVCMLALMIPVANGAITIERSLTTQPTTATPSVPWIPNPQDTAWRDGKPIWDGKSNGVAGRVWIGCGADGFSFRIVVNSQAQNNPYHERNLWRGDCIYVGLDARGDDTATSPPQADDAVYNFGLGSNGAEAQIVSSGDPAQLLREKASLLRSIVRDESAKTTTYDVLIPYDRVSTAIGQSAIAGFAVIIAHKDKDGKDLMWGRPTATETEPRVWNRFALPTPPGAWATIAPTQLRLSSPNDSAEIGVALRATSAGTIKVTAGDAAVTTPVTASDDVQRWIVKVPYEQITASNDEVRVSVEPNGASATYSVLTPRVVMQRLEQRIEKLSGNAPNDLVRNHLVSTKLVVADAYSRLAIEDPKRAAEFMDAVMVILDKLPTDAIEWHDYAHKCIPMVFAFVSEADQTLQFYALQLPYDYQAGQRYPLTVYLHGAGDSNPISGLTTAFDNSHQDTLFRTVTIAADHVPPSHRGFVLAPWARGNSMYLGNAEKDVYQAMKMVNKAFVIDADRVYMTGFSMGCSGAMHIASRSPDLFAGVNLSSGFGWWSDTEVDYLSENLRGVPLALWAGELDDLVVGAREMDKRLTAMGIDHRLVTVPLLPHTYPYDEFQKNVGYLMQFTRKRPAKFSYTSDTPEHTGRNGISMMVPLHLGGEPLPKFTCDVEGSVVTIDSQNTAGLSADLGQDGLGLTGEVKVIWNGKQVYSGVAKRIELGDVKINRW